MPQCLVVQRKDIDATLAQAPVMGKHLLEPLKSLAASNGLPFNILEDCEVVSNDAEVHEHEGDLWLCLEGEVHFVVDGKLANPQQRTQPDGRQKDGEFYGEHIKGGNEKVLKPGDWLWVPPGQPHQHTCGSVTRLIIIKIPKQCV